MKELFRRILGTKPKAPVTEYTTIAGHKFRVLDPLKMPKIRQAALYIGEYERDWGMTKADLLAYDDVIARETEFPNDWVNKDSLIHDLTEKLKIIYNLVDARRLLIQEDFQYKPFLKAACHIILLDDEKPEKIDGEIYSKKLALCEAHEEIEVFFLRVIRTFQNATTGLSDTSETLTFLPAKHLKPTERTVLGKINQTI